MRMSGSQMRARQRSTRQAKRSCERERVCNGYSYTNSCMFHHHWFAGVNFIVIVVWRQSMQIMWYPSLHTVSRASPWCESTIPIDTHAICCSLRWRVDSCHCWKYNVGTCGRWVLRNAPWWKQNFEPMQGLLNFKLHFLLMFHYFSVKREHILILLIRCSLLQQRIYSKRKQKWVQHARTRIYTISAKGEMLTRQRRLSESPVTAKVKSFFSSQPTFVHSRPTVTFAILTVAFHFDVLSTSRYIFCSVD